MDTLATSDDLDIMNRFYEAAYLNKTHDPYFVQRKEPKTYANCLIASCEYDNWWYKPFIGLEFFGELIFYGKGYPQPNELKEVMAVRLVNNKVHKGRTISANDIILL